MPSTRDSAPPPVEHRLFGLDRRVLWPTIGVLLAVIFYGGVIPLIDESVSADEITAGTELTLGAKGVEVSFTPTPGWVISGVPAPSAPKLEIFEDGISFKVQVGVFEGTPEELLDDVRDLHDEFGIEGDPAPLTTTSGIPGVAVELTGIAQDGGLFALVAERPDDAPPSSLVPSIGIQIIVEGPPAALDDHTEDIAEMIASFEADFGTAS